MATRSFMPLPRIASACRRSRSSRGPRATELYSLTLLFHIENPSWCSATGPANPAAAAADRLARRAGVEGAARRGQLGRELHDVAGPVPGTVDEVVVRPHRRIAVDALVV